MQPALTSCPEPNADASSEGALSSTSSIVTDADGNAEQHPLSAENHIENQHVLLSERKSSANNSSGCPSGSEGRHTQLSPAQVAKHRNSISGDSDQLQQRLQIQQRLQQSEPLTWIFAGDSEVCSTPDSVETFPRFVADRMKFDCGRRADIFVNATFANARMKDVRKNLWKRLKRIEPDLVTIICGYADCEQGVKTFQDFERSLMELMIEIHDVGAVPVICTPCHSDVPVESAEYIDRLIYIEAIRACVAENGGFLVDNWEFWMNRSDSARLWNSFQSRPTSIGLQEMERLFLTELQIRETDRRDHSPENVSENFNAAR